jgi:cell division transport system ATP-binding protein
VITFEKAGFAYGSHEILRDISLALPVGSFSFLTGPSGSGKTTFLRLCHLALRPTSGSMSLSGQDCAGLTRDDIARARRKIGFVHQDCQFLDHLSLRENIGLPLAVAGQSAEKYATDLDDLMNWVDLGPRADALPPELSGGERQRAALARAIIPGPDLIIADEPTGNIDWEMGQRILTLLAELNRLGKTVIVATHDLNLIRAAKSQVQARVLRLVKGELQTAGAEL